MTSRRLSEKVRLKLLKECDRILDGDDNEAKKELLLKMCNTLLPRLNAGRDDNERLIPKPLLAGKSNDSSNNGDKEIVGT